MQGRILAIGGSDSGGGAGIQADIKTVTALGGYAATAITALTAQNTLGVHELYDVPPEFVAKQIRAVLADIGADVIKIGMLANSQIVEIVADTLMQQAEDIPIILDPVMVAKGGERLLADDAVDTLKKRLLPMANLITPNIPEAVILSGHEINSEVEMIKAGQMIYGMGAKAVLMKGGHMAGDMVKDILIASSISDKYTTSQNFYKWENKRIDSTDTHGTGCTLASAIATGLAQNIQFENAITRAHEYVQQAIESAPGFGSGHGPLNHCIR